MVQQTMSPNMRGVSPLIRDQLRVNSQEPGQGLFMTANHHDSKSSIAQLTAQRSTAGNPLRDNISLKKRISKPEVVSSHA